MGIDLLQLRRQHPNLDLGVFVGADRAPDRAVHLGTVFLGRNVHRPRRAGQVVDLGVACLFQDGSYVPLAVVGARSPNVVAFGRRLGDQCAIAVVPRFVTELVPPDCDPLAETVWQDTHLVLPEGFPRTWKNALTQEAIAGSGTLAIADALRQFPVALLVGAEA